MTEQARPTRADEVKTERRRQRGSTAHTGMKLGVNEALLDRKNFEYRWINDKAGRIDAMTKNDDWDLVVDPSKQVKGEGTNEGSYVSIHVGTGENNQPLRAYLARKPKAFYDEDQADKKAELDKTMEAIKRGKPQTAGAQELVPGAGISIQEGRRA